MTDTDLPAPTEEHRFPCPNCGGNMRFDAEDGHLECPHCGHSEGVEPEADPAEALRELDFETALGRAEASAEIEETRVVACPACGARTEISEATQAAHCPFCDTPVVTDTGIHRHIKPAAVLPFRLTEAAAQEAMSRWLGGLWFAPNGLRAYARAGRRMSSIYVPYWTFDARTESDYRGARGDDYWVTRRRGKETVRERRTRWRSVRGRVARTFDDVVVLASRSLPKRFTDALQPWDLGALAPYAPQYLAGHAAEAYQVDLREGYAEARGIMDGIIRQDVRRDIGGDHQRISALDTRVWDVTFKHVLLPVWLAAYKYRGETYRFVVNGQTGKVRGERPWSAWKIALAVLAALILAGAAYLLSATN